MSADFQTELDFVSVIAKQAGELVVHIRDHSELGVEMKAGNEPVTVADRQASEFLVGELAKTFPNDVIISEENADDDRRQRADRVWFIDPIDGTKDYIRGEDGYCVMIGLAIRGRPTMGVVYAPASARTFAGALGHGAWVTLPDQTRHAMKVSTRRDLQSALLVASKSHRSDTLDRVKSALGIANEHNVGSIGLKLGLIALGERDLYVNPTSRCSTWDTCAPEAILLAAGGALSDLDGKPLEYVARENHHPRGLLASNGLLHKLAVDKVAPLFPNLANM